MSKIHPAILVKDIEEYKRQMDLAATYTNEIDIDIIDWKRHDIKTISIDQALSIESDLIFNLDLMLDFPSKVLPKLVMDERVQRIIINMESDENMGDLLNYVKSHDIEVGISLNPENTIDQIEQWLPHIDLVQIFTIEPGAQGNPLLKKRFELVQQLKDLNFDGLIETDGGFNEKTADFFKKHAVDIFSVGSALSKAEDPKSMFEKLIK